MKVEQALTNTTPEHIKHRLVDISRVVNGKIEFGSPKNGPINMDGYWVSTTTPSTPNTEFTVTHTLGRIPSGMLVMTTNGPAHIYASRLNQWTKTQAFFKCDTASVSFTGFVV